ncbi:helix-turn-helix transcriptional regulator [Actinomadura rupiterrae]|uniref:helix-turn-helix transcriptional regulator n=1 Tax=Actinomadura rupiterrae TaxID=559627 RepID=UPI0020A6021F|nr:WYL domain-containing protein [Actinomadura rupiterrae]MCP2341584.1 putative DNA-binding transcriptional regulator YafY [Actinomadura rupiterrae]
MLETSARLLRLLSLLQSPRDWPGSELAEQLGVSPRTIRRDVDRLRELGYVVHATAGAPGYRLGAGTGVPPLLLDEEEAVAVAVGLGTAAVSGVAGIGETSVRALEKLEQVLPSRLRHRVGSLRAATVPLAAAGAVDPATLTAIAAAIGNREGLRFDYRARDGAEAPRAAEPYRLASSGRRWYLVAWDTGRGDWRTFRVDRMRLRSPNGPRFTPREPPGGDLARYVAEQISVRPYRYQGRFTLHAPAGVVAARVPPTVATVEPRGEDACVLNAGSNTLDELAVWVAQIGVPFEVHEPPELAVHLRALAARLLDAAAAVPASGETSGETSG